MPHVPLPQHDLDQRPVIR